MRPSAAFLLLLGLVLGVSRQAAAQSDPPGFEPPEDRIEKLFSRPELDADFGDLYQSYIAARQHPYEINRVSRRALEGLQLLRPRQVANFIAYRDSLGPFLDFHELQAIPAWDLATIRAVAPFLYFEGLSPAGKKLTLPAALKRPPQAYLLTRSEWDQPRAAGFSPNTAPDRRFQGSRLSRYLKLRYAWPGRYSANLTLENDPGEPFRFHNGQAGADYLSFHASIENWGALRHLTLGDYELHFGQGLVFGRGFFRGKGGEAVLSTYRGGEFVRGYTSVREAGFLRGAAATYQPLKGLRTGVFLSRNRNDAFLQEDSSGYTRLSSFDWSGLHRNRAEGARRRNTSETTAGAFARYQIQPGLEVGLLGAHFRWSEPLQPRPSLGNTGRFAGQSQSLLSASARYNFQNYLFFAEAALSGQNRKGALLAGTQVALSQAWSTALLLRHYSPGYFSPYARAFGENYQTRNEQGLYYGLSYEPREDWQFSAWFDRYRQPGFGFRSDGPAQGYETLLRAELPLYPWLRLSAQYRYESEERNTRDPGEPTNRLRPDRQHWGHLDLHYQPVRGFYLRTRIQGTRSQFQGQGSGFLLAQDAGYEHGRWELAGRMALFRSSTFKERLYLYERHVLYRFSIPPYFGQGLRQYLLLKYRPRHDLTLYLRWARTYKPDQNELGSGLNSTTGNRRDTWTFSLKWDFVESLRPRRQPKSEAGPHPPRKNAEP